MTHMHPGISKADQLRTPDEMQLPDVRSQASPERARDVLAQHHDNIARLELSAQVPEAVAVQFETARNLYLYAWHVYRFYPVAEMQALGALEFGLRDRFPAPLPAAYWSNAKRDPTLHALLRYAADQALIKNEGFSRWHAAARRKAHNRQEFEAFEAAIAAGETSFEIKLGEVVITTADQSWDLVGILRDSLPKTRNLHAHGGRHLYPGVLGTLELVAEILNQLYPTQSSSVAIKAP
jgi:hypothetical protein